MNHECVIGLLGFDEYAMLATISHLKDHIADRVRQNKYLREVGIESKFLYYKEWSLRDYADKRKNTNLTRFDYCPECGNKIDWGAIRKEG